MAWRGCRQHAGQRTQLSTGAGVDRASEKIPRFGLRPRSTRRPPDDARAGRRVPASRLRAQRHPGRHPIRRSHDPQRHRLGPVSRLAPESQRWRSTRTTGAPRAQRCQRTRAGIPAGRHGVHELAQPQLWLDSSTAARRRADIDSSWYRRRAELRALAAGGVERLGSSMVCREAWSARTLWRLRHACSTLPQPLPPA